MKLSSLPVLAAAAITVSAAPATPTPANDLDVVFQARNFSASCVPHSALCLYVSHSHYLLIPSRQHLQ